jgi:hypothetical protein
MTTEQPPAKGSRRLGIRWGSVLVGIALLLAGLFLVYQDVTTEDQTARFEGITRIEFDVHNAPVTIAGSPDTERVTVDTTSTKGFLGGSVGLEPVGDTLRIVHRCPIVLGFNCRATFELTVPGGTTVTGRTSNGAVSAADLTGEIDVRTSNGAISLETMSGRLHARTSNGAVIGENISSGSVTFQTSNGRIRLDFASAPDAVDLRTANGAVEVTLPADAPAFAVSTRTSNGRVETNIRTDPASSHRIDVRTSNGNITIRYH